MTECNNIRKIEREDRVHRVILGLDISTSCIGASIVIDDGESLPEIVKITQISPKVPKGINGIESLFIKKQIFENEFIIPLKDFGITDVIIEEPLLASNNVMTVGTLIRFNGMISEAIYRHLGLVPKFISSYDSRMFSFPELCSIRKYNKKGKEYPITHIKKDIKSNNVVLFGAYPYDVDKKVIMMDLVNNLYPNIEWSRNAKGEIRKENYDACDSLVCTLAYINVNRYGIEKPIITDHEFIKNENGCIIKYTTHIWGKYYEKRLELGEIEADKEENIE